MCIYVCCYKSTVLEYSFLIVVILVCIQDITKKLKHYKNVQVQTHILTKVHMYGIIHIYINVGQARLYIPYTSGTY